MSFKIEGQAKLAEVKHDPKAINIGHTAKWGTQFFNIWISVTKAQPKTRIQPTFFFTFKFVNKTISIGTKDVIGFYEQMRHTMAWLEANKDRIIKHLHVETAEYIKWKNAHEEKIIQLKPEERQKKFDL